MGRFRIKKTATGFIFRLLDENGEAICVSEVYKTLPSCLNGIKSVRINAPVARVEDQTKAGYKTLINPKFDIYISKNGEYRFRLRARNGQIIAASEGYRSLEGVKNGVESARKNAYDSCIEEFI